MPATDDLTLLTDVQARRALRGHAIHFSVLAPIGTWLGCGALRVLRVRNRPDESVELIVGYESYESAEKPRVAPS